MKTPTARSLFPSGVVAGSYALGDVVGSGGMGLVFLARAVRPVRMVAVKVLKPELAADRMVSCRFRNEFRVCRRLMHTNIARMIEAGREHGTDFIVMEHAPGIPLGRLVAELGAMAPARAVAITIQILDALAHAHGRGVTHGDVKPDNVLIDSSHGIDRLTLIDFGLARLANDSFESDGCVLTGTADYLAPELIRGGVPTAASDVYAAGIMLYELITGAAPFAGAAPTTILNRHLSDPVVPPSLRAPDREIPLPVERAVMRALEKSPELRFDSARAFATELAAVGPASYPFPEPIVHPPHESVSALLTESPTVNWPIGALGSRQHSREPAPRPSTREIRRAA